MIYAYARCSIHETDEEQSRMIYALQAAGAERAVFEYEESDPAEKITLDMLFEHIRQTLLRNPTHCPVYEPEAAHHRQH